MMENKVKDIIIKILKELEFSLTFREAQYGFENVLEIKYRGEKLHEVTIGYNS